MALTTENLPDAGKNSEDRAPTKPNVSGSPNWTAPLFFVGMFLVFLGERVLSSTTSSRVVSTSLGLIAIVGATAVRWFMSGRSGAERKRIERLLASAQIVTIIGVGVALLSNTMGGRLIGLEDLDADQRERWDTILLVAWVTLVLGGLLPLLFAETAQIPMRRAPRPESRRVYSAAAAGLALALALTYLGLFVGSARHWGVAADFAYFKTAKPSESTLKIARNLKEPIQITAFFPAVNEVRTEVERYLQHIARANPKVKFEFVDRVLQPKIARELRVGQDGSVVLSRGEVRQTLTVGLEMKTARATLRNLDQEFQKNLMKLARDARVVYLTTGHHELNDNLSPTEALKEKGISGLKKLLEMQNFRILDLGMPQGLASEIPADANLVMILGPKEPFNAAELAALKRYVERGGAIFLALNPETVVDRAAMPPSASPPIASSAASGAPPTREPSSEPKSNKTPDRSTSSAGVVSNGAPGEALPNLNALAGLVGLSVDPTILANDKTDYVGFAGNKSDRARIVTNRFSSHASVSTLSRHQAWVVLFGAGSLRKLDPNDKDIDFALRSTTSTFQDKNRNFEADSGESRSSYDLAAAVTRKIAPDAGTGNKSDKSSERRAFVIADADLFDDLVLLNAPTNRYLLLDAVRWLGGEESLSGAVNTEEDVRIEHTKEKDILWFYATILGVPALLLGLGLTWSRRSKGHGGNR